MTKWKTKEHAVCSANDMVWTTNSANDCYFCLGRVSRYSKRAKSRIVYSDCPSALCPILSFICMKTFQFPLFFPFLELDNDSSSAESIDFSQTSKSSTNIASMLSDEKLHSSQAADVPQLLN